MNLYDEITLSTGFVDFTLRFHYEIDKCLEEEEDVQILVFS